MRVLITGGAGYIGSHTLLEVLAAGHRAHVVDSFANAHPEVLARVRQLSNRAVRFTEADVRDGTAMAAVVAGFAPEAVIHFAGLKAVGESVARPLDYFDVNVGGTVALLKALQGSACRRFVFSSSATVYGNPDYLPIDEAHPLRATNPYGRTKLQIEGMLQDLAAGDPAWSVALLRYFNPVGAHASGRIGEDPLGVPNNLVPYIAQVAVGRRPALNVFGDDYATPDGTGVRDYIHVGDLARAHLAAMDWTGRARGCEAFNLGTGRGTSVLEMVRAFEAASGRAVPLAVAPRRPGDVAACWADPGRAAAVLGWRAERGIEDMCRSVWRWQSQNPLGYGGTEAPGAAGAG
jgi:UDP-glucose 4-epimerase